MSQDKTLSKKLWTKTTGKVVLSIASGFKGRKFICPIFGTTHSIPKSPVLASNRSYYFIPYRGHTYFLEMYYNIELKKYFYKIGLFESEKDKYHIVAEVSEDLTIRKYFDPAGNSIKSIFEKEA